MSPVADFVSCLLLLNVLAGVSAQASEGDRCVSPDGKQGTCRYGNDCTIFYTLFAGRPSQENIEYLERARCQTLPNRKPPIYCCPESRPTRPEPVSPRPGSTTSRPGSAPSRPATTSTAVGLQDVSNHPNLRLLPMDFCGSSGAQRVFGGEVADVFAYPWMALLGYTSSSTQTSRAPVYKCGGTLVNNRYVLTAAHCLLLSGERLAVVRLGEHTIGKDRDCNAGNDTACIPPPLDMQVELTLPHPSYNANRKIHDIGLVRLRQTVTFRRDLFVRPICLPVGVNQNRVLDGDKLIVAGWGATEISHESNVLLEVFLPIVDTRTCTNAYSPTVVQITEDHLCAGGEMNRDSCSGDSGGPLMTYATVDGEPKMVQFGIVAFGPRKCGTLGRPGVYTRVTHYMQWILDTMYN